MFFHASRRTNYNFFVSIWHRLLLPLSPHPNFWSTFANFCQTFCERSLMSKKASIQSSRSNFRGRNSSYGCSKGQNLSLPKKSPYSELFWAAFSRIRTRMTPNMDSFHAVFTKQKIGKGMLLPSLILIKKFLSEVSFTNIDGVPKSRWNVKAIIIFSLKFTHSETFRHLLGLICKEPRAQQSAMVFELLLPCPLHLVPMFIAIQIDFIFTDITYQ